MPLPTVYRKSPEAIATFSAQDLALGTAKVIYLLARAKNSNIMSRDAVYSDPVATSVFAGDKTSFETVITLDFDVTFKLPQKIKGLMLVSFTQGVSVLTGGKTGIVRTIVTIKHVDVDNNEIVLATDTSDEVSAAGDGSYLTGVESETELIDLEIALTPFKKNEKLRVTMQVQANGNDANIDMWVGIAHDPKDRNDNTNPDNPTINDEDTTIMEAHVPFDK